MKVLEPAELMVAYRPIMAMFKPLMMFKSLMFKSLVIRSLALRYSPALLHASLVERRSKSSAPRQYQRDCRNPRNRYLHRYFLHSATCYRECTLGD